MSKKLKALTCTLLAGVMMATSTGLSVFAADETVTIDENGAEVVVTETPETFNGADVPEDEKEAEFLADEAAKADTETAGEEATEAPVTSSSSNDYASDTYYQNALQVVSALGIITGYEDGSVKPESTVTRAEMATIVLRMLALSANSTYQNVFNDVASSHWAADTIQTAVEQGILDGMGDGTFVPDGNVKYEQVLKMIVCAMNYSTDAENAGGYPSGYVSVASSTLKLTEGVTGIVGSDMPRGEVIKAVYNALLAGYRSISGFDKGYPTYTVTDTLGVEKFNMYEEEGLLTTTGNLSITSGSLSVNGMVTIDGISYYCDLDVDEYIGTKIKFYYIDDKSDTPKIIAMFSKGKSVEYTFDADDIESIDASKISVYTSKTSTSTKKYTLSPSTQIIYNGKLLTEADYDKYIGKSDYYGFITPEAGSVKITDYDNDGTYDVLFVNAYETMLVTTATTEKITGKIDGSTTADSQTIEYDLDDSSYKISVTKSGVSATVKNLKKNDVVSLMRTVDGQNLTFIVTGESITGEITSKGEDDGYTTVTVNGQVYKVAKTVSDDDIRTGVSGTFYLDACDRVGYIELDGVLSGSETYGVITKAFYNDESDFVIRIYTQDGEEIEVKPASSMKFWAPGATEAVSKPADSELNTILSNDDSYLVCDGNPVKLCKYSLNSSGDLSKLYVATDASKVTDSDALTIYSGSLKNIASVGGTVNGYSIVDGIVEFSVPDDVTDRGSGANYGVGTVTAASYSNYDGGVDTSFTVGGFKNSKYPQVLIKFTTSTTSLYGINELDTASMMSTLMVSKINEAVDRDGESIFEIKGYTNGSESEVSYMTLSNTGVYDFTGWNDAYYAGDLLFDATEQDPSDFYDAISIGDIIAFTTGTNTAGDSGIKAIVKMVDVNDVASIAAAGNNDDSLVWMQPAGSSAKGSATREAYYTGFVTAADIEDSAFITLSNMELSASGILTYDTSTVFNYVTISVDENGRITDTRIKARSLEPSQLAFYDPSLGEDNIEFDFALFTAMRGALGTGYVIRVQMD